MSYDCSLNDPVTGEQLTVDFNHQLFGGTYAIGGTNELWVNVTANYGGYYSEATDGDKRWLVREREEDRYELPGLAGHTGAESIGMMKDCIRKIEAKYKDSLGNWLVGNRKKRIFVHKKTHKEVEWPNNMDFDNYDEKIIEYTVSEGDTSDYWEETAANAISALYKLIALAELRPDGVWEIDY